MLVDCPLPLIGYGGARGGGKTDGVLGKFGIKALQYREHFNAIFFRKELPQADDLIERAKEVYLPIGAHWQEQKKLFTFPGGGRLRFRPLENDADAEKYQGQNVSDAAVEEAGNYPSPSPIFKLFGALRSPVVPIQLILTFNPGGPGHSWLKQMFYKPSPKGGRILEWETPKGAIPYIFIPSKVQDNPKLLEKDPNYVMRLHLVGSPELVRAWLDGDFEIHEGSYFPEFSTRHIVEPFSIPTHWPKYVGYDHGYHSPFCAVWGAVSTGKYDDGRECIYPKNSIVIYREFTGKKRSIEDIATEIVGLSGDESPFLVADPSIFRNEGGPSIADQFRDVFNRFKFSSFKPADNDRLSGWSQIRQRLIPEVPYLYFFSSCPYLLDTLPGLVLDKKKPEDLDTTGDDHGADALRYLLKERLLEGRMEIKDEPVIKGQVRVKDYIESVRREQRRVRV